MGSDPLSRWLTAPGIYLGLATLFLMVRLLPFGIADQGWPGPDLMFCLSAAWVQRRPDLLPLGLIAAVAILGDFLLQRPPGLWAALTVLGTEYLRRQVIPGQMQSFPAEFLIFALLNGALILTNWLILALFVVPQPSFGAVLAQWPVTLLAYPVCVFVLIHVLRIRRPIDMAR
ncbi:MAG: rod shape-determining protein MreD [Mangrovicoccus sp.]|nr:rod shape-determining protein MreD [Mangrovicoccus sp.]